MARHLILIGNSEYNDQNYPDLAFVKNDIEKLEKFLGEYCDFRTRTCIFNESFKETEKFLDNYIRILGPGDDLFFYYSGHADVNQISKKLNFIFKDTDYENMNTTSMRSDFLKDFLVCNKSKSKFFILDCCYSGAFIDGLFYKGREVSTEVIEKAQDNFLGDAKGIFGIASSRKSQASHGNGDKSLFTECIVNALETGEADYTGSGYITMDNLWTYINSKFDKKIQVPRDFRNGEGSVYISRVPEVKKEIKFKNIELIESKNLKEIEIRNKKIEDLIEQVNIGLKEKAKMQNEIEQWKFKLTEFKKQKELEIGEKEINIKKTKIKLVTGSYVQFGMYYNEPILWKYMKNDENGYLLVSEYIICLKAFDAAESGKAKSGKNDVEKYGSNKWENSNIREWLNGNDGNVKYSTQPPIKKAILDGDNAYAEEAGFLKNFNSGDIAKIGVFEHDGMSDNLFLLSRDELENLWSSDAGRIKQLTRLAAEKSDYKSQYIKPNGKYWYWTRTPSPGSSSGVYFVGKDGSFYYWDYAYSGYGGVVPALYLKSDICESGKGSKYEPYIV